MILVTSSTPQQNISSSRHVASLDNGYTTGHCTEAKNLSMHHFLAFPSTHKNRQIMTSAPKKEERGQAYLIHVKLFGLLRHFGTVSDTSCQVSY